MKISIDELSMAFVRIIDFYKACGVTTLNFSTDYYLKYLPEDLEKVTEETVLPVIGSLDDDITYLRASLDNDLFTSLDIERVAAIMCNSIPVLENGW